MKEPDGRAEQFARLRKLAVDSFMREDVDCGEIHPDYYGAVQELARIVDAHTYTVPERRLNCRHCGIEFATRNKTILSCSAKCALAFNYLRKKKRNENHNRGNPSQKPEI